MITSWIWYIFTFVYLHLLPCVLRERKEVVKCLMCWSYRLSGPQSFLAWLRGYIQLSEFGVWKLKLRLFNENKPQKHQQNKFCFRLRDQLSVPCLTADVLVSSEGVTPNITQRLMERLFGLEAVYVLVVNLSTTLDSYLRYWPLFISERNKSRKGIQVINIENNANFHEWCSVMVKIWSLRSRTKSFFRFLAARKLEWVEKKSRHSWFRSNLRAARTRKKLGTGMRANLKGTRVFVWKRRYKTCMVFKKCKYCWHHVEKGILKLYLGISSK